VLRIVKKPGLLMIPLWGGWLGI